jgi:hypothetical protein
VLLFLFGCWEQCLSEIIPTRRRHRSSDEW